MNPEKNNRQRDGAVPPSPKSDKFAQLNAGYELYRAARDSGQPITEATEVIFPLIQRQARNVVGKITRANPDKDLADEAAEEVLLNINSYAGLNKAKFSTWAEEVERRYVHKKWKRPDLLDSDPYEILRRVEYQIIKREGAGDASTCIRTLREQQLLSAPEIYLPEPPTVVNQRHEDKQRFAILTGDALPKTVVAELSCQNCDRKWTRPLIIPFGILLPDAPRMTRCKGCARRRGNGGWQDFQPHAFDSTLNGLNEHPREKPSEGFDSRHLLLLVHAETVLSIEERFHLRLKIQEGVSGREAALALKISDAAERQRWKRLTEKLKNHLRPKAA